MKIIDIIVGKRSFLSVSLKEKLKKSTVISINNFDKKRFKEKYKNLKNNVIINHFYPISKINRKNSSYFIKKSVNEISTFLNYLDEFNINKIILSSSSPVYGRNLKNLDFSRYYYGKAKYECEQIIKKFCSKKKCNYSICRIFYMYGGGDKNSVIYKILSSIKNKKKFKIINNGNGRRDFIHVRDVTEIYANLLKVNKNEVIDLGTGNSTKIKDILEMLPKNKLKIINFNKSINEIPTSVAKRNIQSYRLRNKVFIKLENIIKKSNIRFII